MAARLDGHVKGQKRFLGDVAHELCSPLARIRTGLGILEQGLDPEHAGRLASIDEDVAELSELVSEVLAFSKASVAPETVRIETVELLPLVTRAVERECPGHEVDVDVPRGWSVEADRRLLDRAIANLLRNAHRHSGEGCSIWVRASTVKDRVLLNIEDDGPGVTEEALPHLFEPFYRPDESRARSSGGAGLGLAIVASAAAACGGSVEAWRRRPTGLVVILDLPRSGGRS
jgi:two-component system sensor histidine kinase CpxA